MLYFVKIITLVENANLQCTVSGFNKKNEHCFVEKIYHKTAGIFKMLC